MEARSEAWLRRLRRWVRPLDFELARRFGLATREDRNFFFLIVLIGVTAGLLGVVVHALIDVFKSALWRSPGSLLEAVNGVPRWWVVAAPAFGGLLVGLIGWISRQPVAGGGMAALIEAVALSGGKVPPRPVLANALAAIATVGAGGSLGREGPLIRLGAMTSSWLGSRLGLPPHRLKVLVGCGAAAGLAAAYNIPVGGALFAMEVVLGNFALDIFGPIVISSVISTLISRGFGGNVPLYAAPGYKLINAWELLHYVGLGVVGGIASVVFILGIRYGRRVFRGMRFLPEPLKPVLGMTLVGLIALWVPHVLGGGQDTINLALTGELRLPAQFRLPETFTIVFLLGLAAAKLLATALTTGSGAAGGLFTPSLFFGALVGGAYGFWAHSLWPHLASSYGAYAAVGMAAVAAGTSHAPISAILIVFEFTGNYDLILPLMVSAMISSLLSRRLRRYSIYTEALRGRGIELPWRLEEAVLAGLKVEDLLDEDLDTLRPGDPYGKVVEKFLSNTRQRLFVVGEDGRLLGSVSIHHLKHLLDEPPESLTAIVAHDLMTPVDQVIRSGERLHRAIDGFARSDFERLPVVDETGRFLGVIGKRDLLAVYAQEVLGRPALLATFVSSRGAQESREYVHLPPDFSVRMVPVPPGLVGRTLAEARLPQASGARVLEIRRRGGGEPVIPVGDTVFEAGDEVLVVGPTAAVEALAEGRMAPDTELSRPAEAS